jgi:hypothetical protein
MFSVQESVIVRSRRARTKVTSIADFSAATEALILARFTPKATGKSTARASLTNLSAEDLYLKTWERLNKQIQKAVTAATPTLTERKKGKKTKKTKLVPPVFPELGFPSVYLTDDTAARAVSSEIPFGNFDLKDSNNPEGVFWSDDGRERILMKDAALRAGQQIGASFFAQLNRARRIWINGLILNKFPKKRVNRGLGVFATYLSNAWGINVGTRKAGRTVKKKARRKRVLSFSPVFPVSDGKGYEHIGSYRYGRGVSIETDNVWNTMARLDPLSLLDRQTVEDVLDVFIRKRGVTVELEDANGVVRSYQVTKGNPGKLEQKVISQLQKRLTDAQIIDLFGLKSDDPTTLQLSLRNWFADKGRDGIHKIPAINGALSLANLTLHTSRQVCACKAAEADVLIEAFGNQDFVQVGPPDGKLPEGFDPDAADSVTKWLVETTALASASWTQSQQAIRGKVLDKGGGSTLLKSFSDFDTAINQQGAAARAQANQALAASAIAVEQGAANVSESFTTLGDEPGEG